MPAMTYPLKLGYFLRLFPRCSRPRVWRTLTGYWTATIVTMALLRQEPARMAVREMAGVGR